MWVFRSGGWFSSKLASEAKTGEKVDGEDARFMEKTADANVYANS